MVVDGAGPERRSDIAELDAVVRGVLGAAQRKPGTQDMFGCSFGCDELVAQIGLDKDTNTLLTRRMLLLLESAAVLNAGALDRSRRRVLDTCLISGVTASLHKVWRRGPPARARRGLTVKTHGHVIEDLDDSPRLSPDKAIE